MEILANIKNIAIGSLLVVIVIGYYVFTLGINEKQSQIDKLLGENIRLQTSIEEQNNSITRWSNEAKVKEKKLGEVEKKLKISAKQAKEEAQVAMSDDQVMTSEEALKLLRDAPGTMGID